MHVKSMILMLFMISIIATCVKAENQVDKYPENNISKKITKRESSVLIDNYPLDTIINKKEPVLVKRISKPRGRNGDSTYLRPLKRPTHRKFSKTGKKKKLLRLNRMPTGAWSPYKSKQRPYYSYKHGSARRPLKSDYESRPQNKFKSKRKKVNMTRHVYHSLRPVGFGEPPLDFLSHFDPPEAETAPAVDAYGTPLAAPSPRKPYLLNAPLDDDTPPPPPHDDNSFAFSNPHPKIIVPDVNAFDSPLLMDFSDNSVSGLYPSIFKREKNKMFQQSRRRPTADVADEFLRDHIRDERNGERQDGHEIVGGQYAEPPARFVTRAQQNEQFDDDFDEFSPNIFINTKFDSKYASSANISPYVNYKNGNIAFSPQNLNDAFSIIDK